jgi:hypothetical protein
VETITGVDSGVDKNTFTALIIFASSTIFPYTSAISHTAFPFNILELKICAIIFTSSLEFGKNLAAAN